MLCAGHIEYWRPSTCRVPESGLTFTSKMDTDLYAHAKARTVVQAVEVSRDGTQFATFSADRYVTWILGKRWDDMGRERGNTSCPGPL